MTTFNTTELLAGLEADVHSFLQKTDYLKKLNEHALGQQPADDKWSIAQVLAHLNSYNRYYLPHIEAAMKGRGSRAAATKGFKPGWLGNYFTQAMYSEVVSKKQITNKMKSPKDHAPAPVQDVNAVVSEFLAGEKQLIALINNARQVDMAEVRVPISISRWVKISLGDTLRFLIAHQERHFLQISNILAATAK